MKNTTTTTVLPAAGLELISAERKEQIEKHGRTLERDKALNCYGQLFIAAHNLMMPDGSPLPSTPMGWDKGLFDAMCMKPRRERLVIAGALLMADNDRRGAPAWSGTIVSIAREIEEIDGLRR